MNQFVYKTLYVVIFLSIFIQSVSYARPYRRYRTRIYNVSKERTEKFYSKALTFNSYFLNNADESVELNTEEKKDYEAYINTSDSFFSKLLPIEKFNGAILVAKQGKILYERYSGMQDKENQTPVTSETNFHIASISKTITAMVILKLEEQKKINIDHLVVEYLPEFSFNDVTIRSLLNHRSGINGYDNFMDMYWKNKKEIPTNIDVFTNIIVNPKTKIFTSDKRFFYSNSNYAILALIIEKLTGMSYPDYISKYVFEPLKMKSSFIYTAKDSIICTPSYDERGRRDNFFYLDFIYGDKNVYTTLRDLFRWDMALYNPAFFNTETLKKAFTPYSFERNTLENYGLGWRMKYIEKLDRFIPYHYGWWHGNRSIFIRDIEKKITIIILSNKLNKNMYRSLDLIELFHKIES